MDKPNNKSLKEYLIGGVAQRMKIPEHVVEAVVTHQFKGIVKAFQTCKSVEMTGFGKWLYQDAKATRMVGYLEKELEERKQTGTAKKYTFATDDELNESLQTIKNHLAINHNKDADRQAKRNSRGLEKHGGETPRRGRRSKGAVADL